MPAVMLDSQDLTVVTDARWVGMRVATYADLLTPAVVSAVAGKLLVIDRGLGDPMGRATIADCEPRALTVAQSIDRVTQWTAERRPFPTVYHDRSLWDEVNQAGDGLAFSHWVTTLDGTAIPDGYYMAAVQILNLQAQGLNADLSVVWADAWNPVGPGPTPAQLAAVIGLADKLSPGFAALISTIRGL